MSIRGGCDFTKKAEVAQSGGAAALVVINDQEGCNLNTSVHDVSNSHVNIVSNSESNLLTLLVPT